MAAKKESANRVPADKTKKKRKAPKSAWKKGQSGNPAGRPKDGESWASVISTVANMTPEEVVVMVGADNDLGRALLALPKGEQMKYLVSARVFAALMFEPSAGLWNGLMDRMDGKVEQPINMKDMPVLIFRDKDK